MNTTNLFEELLVIGSYGCRERTRSRTFAASGVFQKMTSASSVAAEENSTRPIPSNPLRPVLRRLMLRMSGMRTSFEIRLMMPYSTLTRLFVTTYLRRSRSI